MEDEIRKERFEKINRAKLNQQKFLDEIERKKAK